MERWTESDDELAYYDSLPDDDPARAVNTLRALLLADGPSSDESLPDLVTPEGLADWGDFTKAREFALLPLRVDLDSRRAEGAVDVAFVMFRPEQQLDNSPAAVVAVASVVWRDDIPAHVFGHWLVHTIGPTPIPAESLPRAAGAAERAPRPR